MRCRIIVVEGRVDTVDQSAPGARPHSQGSDDRWSRLPTGSLWRQQIAARGEELSSLLGAFRDTAADPRWAQAADYHLAEALEAAGSKGFMAFLSGAPIQRATHNLDMAELYIYRLAPIEYLNSVLPVLID